MPTERRSGEQDPPGQALADEAPPDFSEVSALIAREQAKTGRLIGGDPRVFFVTWGLVWLVGFGVNFLSQGPNGDPIVSMPVLVAPLVLGVLLVAGIVTTIVASIRMYGHTVGESSQAGMMYGFAWMLAFLMLGVIGSRLSHYLPEREQFLLWSATSTGFVGILYAAGGAVWRNRALFALGLWVSAVNIAGIVAGPGWHALLLSLAGGGGLLVTSVVLSARSRGRCA